MSNTFKGAVFYTKIGGQKREWICDHKHTDIRSAARCGQLQLRTHSPNTRDSANSFTCESITTDVLVYDPVLLGDPENARSQWTTIGHYRQYFDAEI